MSLPKTANVQPFAPPLTLGLKAQSLERQHASKPKVRALGSNLYSKPVEASRLLYMEGYYIFPTNSYRYW